VCAAHEGWLALRPQGRDAHPALLLAPTHQEAARLGLAPSRSNSPTLRVRHSARLRYVDGPGPDDDAPWIHAIDPPGAHGPATLRALFPLRWDPATALQPWYGPAIELTHTLVHAGRSYEQGATYLQAREGTYVVSRRLPDGEARWVYGTDKPLADLDGDERRVYVVYLTGEVETLDTATGEVRARHILRAHGHPVTRADPGLLGYGLTGSVETAPPRCAGAPPRGRRLGGWRRLSGRRFRNLTSRLSPTAATSWASTEPDDQTNIVVSVLGGKAPHRLPDPDPRRPVRRSEHSRGEDHGSLHGTLQVNLAARRPLRRAAPTILDAKPSEHRPPQNGLLLRGLQGVRSATTQ
jgi:hypothetical protein